MLGAPPRRPFVWDARYRAPRATNPGSRLDEPWRRGCPRRARRPYLVLLPVGFTLPATLPPPRCALTAPFHPCPEPEGCLAVSSLWHCPWGRPRRPLAATVHPWSPDFPPPAPEGFATRRRQQRPSGRLTSAIRADVGLTSRAWPCRRHRTTDPGVTPASYWAPLSPETFRERRASLWA